jgi:glutaredoxin
VKVELITRNGCHLCHEALTLLQSIGVEPVLLDVDADPQLFSQYDFRVPVVRVDGRVVGEGAIRREPLLRALVPSSAASKQDTEARRSSRADRRD